MFHRNNSYFLRSTCLAHCLLNSCKTTCSLIAVFLSPLMREIRELSVNHAPHLSALSSSEHKMSRFMFIFPPIFLGSSYSTAHITYLFKYTCIRFIASKMNLLSTPNCCSSLLVSQVRTLLMGVDDPTSQVSLDSTLPSIHAATPRFRSLLFISCTTETDIPDCLPNSSLIC